MQWMPQNMITNANARYSGHAAARRQVRHACARRRAVISRTFRELLHHVTHELMSLHHALMFTVPEVPLHAFLLTPLHHFPYQCCSLSGSGRWPFTCSRVFTGAMDA